MRRRLLPLAATLCVVLAACGGAVTQPSTSVAAATTTTATTTTQATETTALPPPSTTAAPQGPGYGGTVVIGDDQSPPTLNPYGNGGDNFIVATVAQALHTGVWDIDAATLERIPEVVVELPTVANGGVTVNDDRTMTVHYLIRDEAMWADGTPISGDDFAFTYESLTDLAAADAHYGAYDAYGFIDPASLEIGDKTFGYTMTQPTLAHEDLFRWLIPRHQVEGTDLLADWNEAPWFSGGPFVLDSWDRGGSDGVSTSFGRIALLRNDNYWKVNPATGDRLPYLDEVIFEIRPETSELLSGFASRELDVIIPPPWPPELERVLGPAVAEGAVLTVESGPVWEHLSFQFGELNRNADTLNRHVAFRRAVAHAIDRAALAEMAQDGYGQALTSYLDVFMPALSSGAWERYDHNPELASELLGQLCNELVRDCAADPPRLVFSSTSNSDMRPRIAEFVDEALSAVGIDVELQLEDSQLFFGHTLEKGDWDLGLWAWVGEPGYRAAVSIHDIFDPDSPPLSGSNYYRWGTPATSGEELQRGGQEGEYDVNQGPSTVVDEHTTRFAEIVDEMAATVDEEEVALLIAEAEEILADQVVIIPLFARLVASAYWPDEISGFQMNPTQASHTWNIEEWYRVDR